MIEPIRINRPARQKMWVDTYRAQKRRQRIMGWIGGVLLLGAIVALAFLLDGCAGRPAIKWNGPEWRVPIKMGVGPEGAAIPHRHR